MTFTQQKLTGQRVLVSGTDTQGNTGQVVLDSTTWDEVTAHKDYRGATAEFDAKVEEFFAPIMEAAEKLHAAGLGPVVDEDSFVVLDEGTEGVATQERVVLHLDRDGVILRLLDQGQEDRLVWVGDQLEVLAALPGTSVPVATGSGKLDVGEVLGNLTGN